MGEKLGRAVSEEEKEVVQMVVDNAVFAKLAKAKGLELTSSSGVSESDTVTTVMGINGRLAKASSLSDQDVIDLLKELAEAPITLKVLKVTGIGRTVNTVRKSSSNPGIKTRAALLLKYLKQVAAS